MSAIHPAHVYVDEMLIHSGPGEYIMGLLLLKKDFANRIEMTLSTPASTRRFTRKVVVTSIEKAPQEFVIIADGSGGLADKYSIKGRVGDWHFEGHYIPYAKTGKLYEC